MNISSKFMMKQLSPQLSKIHTCLAWLPLPLAVQQLYRTKNLVLASLKISKSWRFMWQQLSLDYFSIIHTYMADYCHLWLSSSCIGPRILFLQVSTTLPFMIISSRIMWTFSMLYISWEKVLSRNILSKHSQRQSISKILASDCRTKMAIILPFLSCRQVPKFLTYSRSVIY